MKNTIIFLLLMWNVLLTVQLNDAIGRLVDVQYYLHTQTDYEWRS